MSVIRGFSVLRYLYVHVYLCGVCRRSAIRLDRRGGGPRVHGSPSGVQRNVSPRRFTFSANRYVAASSFSSHSALALAVRRDQRVKPCV